MIEKLIEIANKYIEINKNDTEEQKKYIIIKKILNKNDCFLHMSIEQSYSILRDLNFAENEIKSIYLQLIDLKNIKAY